VKVKGKGEGERKRGKGKGQGKPLQLCLVYEFSPIQKQDFSSWRRKP
jgi:hypothetical protein